MSSFCMTYAHAHTCTHMHTRTLTHTYTHTYTHSSTLYLVLAEEKYNREVVVIPADFSDGLEIYPNTAGQLKDLDIGVLSKLVCVHDSPQWHWLELSINE